MNSLRIKYFSASIKSDNFLNTIYIEGMTCSHCVDSVKNSLSKITGVSNINVDLASGKVQYSGDDNLNDDIEENILSLGYKIKV